MLTDVVRLLIASTLTAALVLSSMLVGCLWGGLENDFVYADDVVYESTTGTIVEVWENGALVGTTYPV